MKNIYLTLAVIGLVGPNYFIFQFIISHGFDLLLIVNQLYSNFADLAFSINLLLCSIFFWYYMYTKRNVNNMRFAKAYIFLNLMLGLSFSFPLYLYKESDSKNE